MHSDTHIVDPIITALPLSYFTMAASPDTAYPATDYTFHSTLTPRNGSEPTTTYPEDVVKVPCQLVTLHPAHRLAAFGRRASITSETLLRLLCDANRAP